MRLTFAITLLVVQHLCLGQLTLEDIWLKHRFSAKGLNSMQWMENSRYYINIEQAEDHDYPVIKKYKTEKSKKGKTIIGPVVVQEDTLLFSDCTFGPGEQHALLMTNPEKIYRRSVVAQYYIYDMETKNAYPVSDKKISNVTFSPDGSRLAYTYDNNLYLYHIATKKTTAITEDGEKGRIINGHADWVYEEEFSVTQLYEWSADGQYLGYLRFDESHVKEYPLQFWRSDLYPDIDSYKYPKAGEENAHVSVHCYNVNTSNSTELLDEASCEEYIPRLSWQGEQQRLVVQRMNRLQNHLEVIALNPESGDQTLLYEETSSTYIDVPALFDFSADGHQLALSTEKYGYQTVIIQDLNTQKEKKVLPEDLIVDDLYGIDWQNKRIYFNAVDDVPAQRVVWEADIKTGDLKKLSSEEGWNSASFSDDFKYMKLVHATADQPPVSAISRTNKTDKAYKTEKNEALREALDTLNITPPSFHTFTTERGDTLHYSRILPPDFTGDKTYPVLVYVYGGPGSQMVTDQWNGAMYLWQQYLAQQGIVVITVDGRGTGGRGADFTKQVYGDLGAKETEDVLSMSSHLQQQSWVKADKTAIWGWSYGGYLSSLALVKGEGAYCAAVAVAPVTNWRFYDTIYTERYLKTPQENPEGYDDNSPLYFADGLRGQYLIIHGTGDDNVHVQNTMAMSDALIRSGKSFESHLYPDRNHGIYGGNTRFHLFKKITTFITSNLL